MVGAGYIGLEMAEALHRRGLQVRVVERSEQPMSTLDPDMGALVADAIRGLGIELHLGVSVEGFATAADGRVNAVQTSDGEFRADLVVLGLGVRPASRLAEEAGIDVGKSGGIVTDPRMATSVEGIWAAGDCTEVFHRVSRRPVAIALGTHANKQGRVAGVNATGGDVTFPGVVGTAVTKFCDTRGRAHGPHRARSARSRFSCGCGDHRVDDPRRLLPGQRTDHREDRRRRGDRSVARRAGDRP